MVNTNYQIKVRSKEKVQQQQQKYDGANATMQKCLLLWVDVCIKTKDLGNAYVR